MAEDLYDFLGDVGDQRRFKEGEGSGHSTSDQSEDSMHSTSLLICSPGLHKSFSLLSLQSQPSKNYIDEINAFAVLTDDDLRDEVLSQRIQALKTFHCQTRDKWISIKKAYIRRYPGDP